MKAPPIELNPPRKSQGQEWSSPIIIRTQLSAGTVLDAQFPAQQQAAIQVQIVLFGQTPGGAEPDRNALLAMEKLFKIPPPPAGRLWSNACPRPVPARSSAGLCDRLPTERIQSPLDHRRSGHFDRDRHRPAYPRLRQIFFLYRMQPAVPASPALGWTQQSNMTTPLFLLDLNLSLMYIDVHNELEDRP
jgi:hypothetical protein